MKFSVFELISSFFAGVIFGLGMFALLCAGDMKAINKELVKRGVKQYNIKTGQLEWVDPIGPDGPVGPDRPAGPVSERKDK